MPGDELIIRFVKETLGCKCPDDVFKRIGFMRQREGSMPDAEITVGNRLLIHIAEIRSHRPDNAVLEKLLREGSAKRDSLGLNRFRLVIAVDEPDAFKDALREKFESLKLGDDKLHLHVIARGDRLLASLLG